MSSVEASTSEAKPAAAPETAPEVASNPSPTEKKKNPMFRFLWQSYKTPEEKVAEENQAVEVTKKEETKQENVDPVRNWFHANVAQSISPKTPLNKPPPTPEEKEAARKKKEEERANKKPFMQRIKEAFRSGKSKTSSDKTPEEKEEVTPAQGPGTHGKILSSPH